MRPAGTACVSCGGTDATWLGYHDPWVQDDAGWWCPVCQKIRPARARPPGWDELLPQMNPHDQLTVARMLAWNQYVDSLVYDR